jgi:predicted small lipoprotein YifL
MLALSMLLLGCGQKGPLTLPTANGAASAPAASK